MILYLKFSPGSKVTKKSSVSGLFKHTFIYGLGDLARKLVGFLLIPIYTRFMSPGEYGILQLSLLFIAFFQILYSFGMTTAFFRYYLDSEDEEKRRRVFSTTLWSVIVIDMVLSIVMIVNAETVSDFLFGTPDEQKIVTVVILVLLVESTVQIPLLLLRALNLSKTFLFFIVTQLVTALAANVIFVAYLRMGPFGAMLANLIASILLLLLLLPLVMKNIGWRFSLEALRRLLRFGLPFIPSMISMMLMNLSDQYLIRYFRGLEETGLYALSYKFGMAINLFITGFRFAWVPFIFRVSDEPDASRMYARAFEITAVILSLIFFLICTFLPEIYRVLVEKSYFSTMGIVPLIAFSYILFGLHIIFLAGIYLEDQTAFIAKAGMASASLNLVLNLIIIPRYGAWGAAVTTLISFAMLISLIYRKAQAVHRIQFDISRAGRVLLLSVVLMSAARLIDWGGPLTLLWLKFVIFIIYLAILRSMGYIRKEKLQEVAGWIKREPAR